MFDLVIGMAALFAVMAATAFCMNVFTAYRGASCNRGYARSVSSVLSEVSVLLGPANDDSGGFSLEMPKGFDISISKEPVLGEARLCEVGVFHEMPFAAPLGLRVWDIPMRR